MTRTSDANPDSAPSVAYPSAELHRKLADSIPDCSIIALDLNGRVLTWNAGARRITGYDGGEMLGRPVSALYPPDEVAAGRPQRDLADAHREGRIETETWCVAKDGSWIRVRVAITAMHDDEGAMIGYADVMRRADEAIPGDLERLIRLREEMLAIVAHDLRNPMHAIMAAASMLALQAPDDQHRRRIAIIQRSAKEMERLLTDLLDVARIESGHLVVRREAIDLQTLLEETTETFHGQATAIGITLVCEVAAGIPPVSGDRDRVVQVLSNLIANALKFTPAGGRVSVRGSRDDASVHLSVKDSGDGIPPEDLSRVFDRFWRADPGSTAGAGLGLAICKSIVEAHGGRIWAASRVGRGTTFHFTLPYDL